MYTPGEVARHHTNGDAWVIVNGAVYDMSSYADSHPGGLMPILKRAGKDVSGMFWSLHSVETISFAKRYYIGELSEEGKKEQLLVRQAAWRQQHAEELAVTSEAKQAGLGAEQVAKERKQESDVDDMEDMEDLRVHAHVLNLFRTQKLFKISFCFRYCFDFVACMCSPSQSRRVGICLVGFVPHFGCQVSREAQRRTNKAR